MAETAVTIAVVYPVVAWADLLKLLWLEMLTLCLQLPGNRAVDT